MKRHRKFIYIISLLCFAIVFLIRCVSNSKHIDPRGRAFAGSESCQRCHRAIYDSFVSSAHAKATTDASEKNILGSFHKGKNEFAFNDSTKIIMEKRDSGFYQVLYVNGREKEAYRFDITFGLRNAQTWLYWQGDKTYELPISFYTSVHNWATSPGFSATRPDFTRFIGKDCFECHSSNIGGELIASTAGIKEVMKTNSIVYGIDCERCHGPAASHVYIHSNNPQDTIAKNITKIGSLNQHQRLDMCALCHSGNDRMKFESRFLFRPGDSLQNFFMDPEQSVKNDLDVHGNQHTLMSKSKCFLASKKMTCATCHDPHRDATEGVAFYSQKCIGCHSQPDHTICPKMATIGPSINNNCIDCHMPKKPSKAISFQLSGDTALSSYLLRTHKMGIYPEGKEK